MKIVIKAFAARHKSSVDDAGERKGFAAAADSIGNQRSGIANAVNFAPFVFVGNARRGALGAGAHQFIPI
jgi:hypothetical protein